MSRWPQALRMVRPAGLAAVAIGVVAGTLAGGPLGQARAVAAVVATRTAVAWGFNGAGALGDGTTTSRAVFGAVSGLSGGVVQVAAGLDHSLAVTSAGTVWAWGDGAFGELGDGSAVNSPVPVQAQGLTGVSAVAAGYNHSLALRSDGTVWAWGGNNAGELGSGTTTSSSVPVRVRGLTGVTEIAAGQDYSLALRSDGTVWAWGENAAGQLGNGTTANSLVPVRVSGLSQVTSIAAGTMAGYAIRTSSTGQTSLWAWGSGPLGDGTTAGHLTARQVTGIAAPGIASISAGSAYALALGTDGSVWGWGDDTVGELGTAPASGWVLRPVRTRPPGSGIVQLAAGLDVPGLVALTGVLVHTLALTAAGTVWAWGDNSSGQLGDGTTSGPAGPVQVAGLSGVTQVAAGALFSLAVTTLARVPSVVDDTTSAASTALQAAGLVLGQVTHLPDYTCNSIGVIKSQTPGAGTWTQPGSAVAVTVGDRPPQPCP